MDLIALIESLAEGKALATHPNPVSKRRHGLAKYARTYITLSPYGDHPSYKADADRQFQGIQGRFRMALRRLLRSWEGDHDTPALLKASEPIFRKFWTQAYKVGLTTGDLSRHLQPTKRRIYKPVLFTRTDQKWIDSAVDEELGYWAKLVADVHHGRSRTDPYTRVDYYTKSLESPYHAGRVVALPHLQQIKWEINPSAEHCLSCQYLELIGPFTKESLPCTPRDGSTICKFNCKCKLVYSDVDEAKYKELSKKDKRGILARVQGYQ